MPVVTLSRARRTARPGPLARLVLDPVGRPKAVVWWAITALAIAAFASAFAATSGAPKPAAAALAPDGHAAVPPLSAGAVPAAGSLHGVAALPALAAAPRRRHLRAAATPTRVATAVPTAVPTASPVVVSRPRPRGTPAPVFDTTG
jgi:hypothetical protein